MKKLAIFISGGGTTAEATIKACQRNELTNLEPIVISSNKEAKGNQRAKNLGIKVYVVDKNEFADKESFNDTLTQLVEKLKIDLISLQGWVHLVPQDIVKKYIGKVINQHPGPLDPGKPDFGGKGMMTGYRTNCARIAYVWATGEEPWTESDTHYVTEEFDMGNVIRTEKMKIPSKKKRVTIDELRANAQELIKTTHEVQAAFYPIEHHNVIKTLDMFVRDNVKEFKRRKPLVPMKYYDTLVAAKKLATELFPNYNL